MNVTDSTVTDRIVDILRARKRMSDWQLTKETGLQRDDIELILAVPIRAGLVTRSIFGSVRQYTFVATKEAGTSVQSRQGHVGATNPPPPVVVDTPGPQPSADAETIRRLEEELAQKDDDTDRFNAALKQVWQAPPMPRKAKPQAAAPPPPAPPPPAPAPPAIPPAAPKPPPPVPAKTPEPVEAHDSGFQSIPGVLADLIRVDRLSVAFLDGKRLVLELDGSIVVFTADQTREVAEQFEGWVPA